MEKDKYEKAKKIMLKIEDLEHEARKVEETGTVYYKTPDMDGGFTPGQYVAFYEEAKGRIKEAIMAYYRQEISKLEQLFKEL